MDNILGLPLNRFVVFVKPAINWLAALIAAWLVTKVNVFGIAGLDQSNVQTYVGFALTAAFVGGLHQIGDLKWIHGHHIELLNGTGTAAVVADDPALIPPDEGDPGQPEAVEPPISLTSGTNTTTGQTGISEPPAQTGTPPEPSPPPLPPEPGPGVPPSE